MFALLRRSVLLAAVGALVLAAGAQADPLLDGVTSSDCQRTISVPFAPWGDSSLYFLVPNGDFSSGADGWQGGDAVADSSPLSGGTALHVADGDSATSPGVCVGLDTPTMRFLARNTGDSGGALDVDVRFETHGMTVTLPIGEVQSDSAWAPSPKLPIVAHLLGLLGASHTPVAFGFTADGGDWVIDDVYVDPYGKG